MAEEIRDPAGISLRLLGHPDVSSDGASLPIGRRHLLALLAVLAEAGAPVPRGRLGEMLWPETDEETVRARLRRVMHRLGEALGRAVLRSSGDTVALDPAHITVDSRRFATLAEDALRRADGDALEDAARLYGGPFLDGFELPGSPDFDDWIVARRSELDRLQTRVLRELAQKAAAKGQVDLALAAALRLLALDPFRESSHRLVMRLHAQAGDRGALEAAYAECVRVLDAELGTKPSAETEEEYRRLSRMQAEPRGARAQPTVQFADADGGSVAYVSFGAGPPVLIVPGFVSHIEMLWEEPRLSAFVMRMARTNQVICFDRRGLGISERLGIQPSVDNAVSDIGAILDHAGVKRAVLFGASEGGLMSMRFASESPDRVHGLVLFDTLARGGWAPDYPWALRPEALDRWRAILVKGWGTPASIETFAPSACREPELRAWWARTLRQAATPKSIEQVLSALGASDVRALLPHLRVRTTVLHRRDDRAVLFGAGEHLARNIPGARFVPLDGADHWWWIGDQEPIFEAIAAMSKAR
jgi:DNA-binding SARP family transcriptional activator/pimeloyl-ACP methyl ester carboxylesterase